MPAEFIASARGAGCAREPDDTLRPLCVAIAQSDYSSTRSVNPRPGRGYSYCLAMRDTPWLRLGRAATDTAADRHPAAG